MNYYTLGSDGGGCYTFIQYQDQSIGYTDGQPFISSNKTGLCLNTLFKQKENKRKRNNSIH